MCAFLVALSCLEGEDAYYHAFLRTLALSRSHMKGARCQVAEACMSREGAAVLYSRLCEVFVF